MLPRSTAKKHNVPHLNNYYPAPVFYCSDRFYISRIHFPRFAILRSPFSSTSSNINLRCSTLDPPRCRWRRSPTPTPIRCDAITLRIWPRTSSDFNRSIKNGIVLLIPQSRARVLKLHVASAFCPSFSFLPLLAVTFRCLLTAFFLMRRPSAVVG